MSIIYIEKGIWLNPQIDMSHVLITCECTCWQLLSVIIYISNSAACYHKDRIYGEIKSESYLKHHLLH